MHNYEWSLILPYSFLSACWEVYPYRTLLSVTCCQQVVNVSQITVQHFNSSMWSSSLLFPSPFLLVWWYWYVMIIGFFQNLKPRLVDYHFICRPSERMTEPRLVGRSCLKTPWEKQLMHGKGSTSSVLMVSFLLLLVYFAFVFRYFFSYGRI